MARPPYEIAGNTVAALDRFSGWQDAFVAKLDRRTGETLWLTQLGSEDVDSAEALAIGADVQIYVAGNTYGSLAAPARGGGDIFVAELSPDGR
jgi:hypothetical protein